VKQGLLIYSAIPLSAIGGIFALAARGIPFSISAGVGFIALFGVSVLNGIVLIAEFNRLKKSGTTDLKRIVTQGTKIRLRPVLMTGLVASLGFLPMALSHGEGAEVQRPLATVVIGGLLIATFLTLFVLPIIYIMFEKGISLKRKPVIAAGILLIICLSMVQETNSQVPITLEAATDTALKNNLTVKSERLRSAYQEQLVKSSKTIPATNFFGEFGQFNSSYSDTRFGLAQTIGFPKVYSTQKALLTEQWKSSVLNTGVKEALLRRQVSQAYYSLLYLREKEKLLQKNDSLFAEFLNKATLRFNKGESNILEKTTAENQRGEITLQLNQLRQDMDLVQLQFQLLLNSGQDYIPDQREVKLTVTMDTSSSVVEGHPTLQYYRHLQDVAAAMTQVERSKLKPDITVGYNLMSMKGTGADNKAYDGTPQFHSGQVGLGIPIFRGAQKARINAAKINESAAASDYEMNLQNLESNYRMLLSQYQKYSDAILYYETTGLKNADVITATANKQFLNGDINFLEWVLLINQSVSIQNAYVETVKDRNSVAIEIFSYTNK